MKKTNGTIKGKVEVEIGGVKYCGVIDLKPVIEKAKRGEYPVWGVRIDRVNAHPETSVEYIGDAEGYAPANGTDAGSWASNPIFAKIKPCLMKDGEVVAYLNPDNFNLLADGQPAALRGYFDTMIEFGKMFYRISQDDHYTYVEVTDSDKSLADGFTDYAFSYKGKVRDKFYIGAYLGHIDREGKLRSVVGQIPTGDKTLGAFRTAAQKNGDGYEILPFNKLTLLQVLYLIRYKSLNSQEALGKGLTDSGEYGRTGDTDERGLYYGEQDAETRVKCHGIEDFWGNKLQWVDGFITNNKIAISDGNFNDNGEGYEKVADLPKSIYGIMTDIYGDNLLGFVPKEANDDADPGEEYFCNYASTWTDTKGSVPYFGGSRGDGAYAGAFSFYCSSASFAYSVIGARLVFCGKEERK